MHDRDADAPDDPGVLLLEPLLVAGRGGEALEVGRPVGLRRVEEEVALQAAVLGGRRRRRPRRGDPRHRRRGRHPLRRRFAHRGGTRMQRLGRDLDDGVERDEVYEVVDDGLLHLLQHGLHEGAVVLHAARDERRRELDAPVVAQAAAALGALLPREADAVVGLRQVLLGLVVLDDLGVQEADALLVREGRPEEAVLAVVGAGAARHHLAVGPVGRGRVLLEAGGEVDAGDRVSEEVVEQHAVDGATGEARVAHEVRRALLVAEKGEDVAALGVVQPHRAVVDVVRHGESGDRDLGLGVAARVAGEVAAPLDPRGLGHAGHMPLNVAHDADPLQAVVDKDLVPVQRVRAEGLPDLEGAKRLVLEGVDEVEAGDGALAARVVHVARTYHLEARIVPEAVDVLCEGTGQSAEGPVRLGLLGLVRDGEVLADDGRSKRVHGTALPLVILARELHA
mmetsp:Transcript_16488/g.39357  ORF Transcript_16488/g.39357 Transcript_16488/m.39357 type:complete len:452 (+) Transcript_16488:2210-3565(+)